MSFVGVGMDLTISQFLFDFGPKFRQKYVENSNNNLYNNNYYM